MNKWSKLPPRRAGLHWFRGARITYRTQRVSIDEPVRLMWIQCGKSSELAVIMLGTQRRHPLTAFEGEWQPLACAAIPDDIKRTLVGALNVEREEYGECAETVNARLWLEGKLHAAAPG